MSNSGQAWQGSRVANGNNSSVAISRVPIRKVGSEKDDKKDNENNNDINRFCLEIPSL